MGILIIGGGICGLGAAMMLARDGHDVTVLERDATDIPDSVHDCWQRWTRPGVAQFHQPHNFMPGMRHVLEAELPDVQEALARAGAGRFDLLNPMPPSISDRSPRPVDDTLWTLTARRPVGEWVFADAARREPRVTIRRGVQVSGLTTGTSAEGGIPHVTGVRTTQGEELRADLVVDATGRQSKAHQWLAAIGTRPPIEEQADCGFIYYTRYFRGSLPQRRGGVLMPIGSISVLTIPGDNSTWSVTVFAATGDQPLKALRHEATFTNVIRACPLHAHWLDGEPIGAGVHAMAGIVDRYRRFVVDGSPIVTGFVAVADAWACTNPSAGRGLTVGLMHAQRLRDAARRLTDPVALVEELDATTEKELRPWYEAQRAVDRARFAQIEAIRTGRQPAPPTDELTLGISGLMATMTLDADLFRAAMEYVGTITPIQQILARPSVRERIQATREAVKKASPPPVPGPTREQLLEIVAG
jgi:2-polyprenyl-6-methoxyphenol hydroxylase-like FAD-dependent oxidoreductase